MARRTSYQATKLPELQKQRDGKPVFQLFGKRTRTYVETDNASPNFNKQMREVSWERKPLLVNHKVQLVEIYKAKGMEACKGYISYCTAIGEAGKLQQKAAVNDNNNLITQQNAAEEASITENEGL